MVEPSTQPFPPKASSECRSLEQGVECPNALPLRLGKPGSGLQLSPLTADRQLPCQAHSSLSVGLFSSISWREHLLTVTSITCCELAYIWGMTYWFAAQLCGLSRDDQRIPQMLPCRSPFPNSLFHRPANPSGVKSLTPMWIFKGKASKVFPLPHLLVLLSV